MTWGNLLSWARYLTTILCCHGPMMGLLPHHLRFPYTILLCIDLEHPMSPRGGFRPGAGRKPGSNDYGESTRAIRVPVSLYPEIQSLLESIKARRRHGVAPEGAWLPDRSALKQAFPLYASRVPAGFPSPADDYVDQRLDLNDLIERPASTFFVTVTGDSMTGASIHDGDLLMVDRSLEPIDGKIVIAAINGELTVKRLALKNGQAWLIPENPAYAPLELKEGLDCVIWGVVTRVIHTV
jgi:DNA polymerase V